MRARDFVLTLDPNSQEPLALQITKALASAIVQGRLRPGTALPGSRTMAEELGVHRNTVLAALRQLEEEGWVESRQGIGTFVCRHLPDRAPQRWGELETPSGPAAMGFDIPSQLSPITAPVEAVLNLSEGLPDVRLAPSEALARAYQRAIRLHGRELLQYGEPQGHEGLRRQLAEMMATRRGMAVDPDQILVTRGGRMGLDLVIGALFGQRGGTVAVEDPGHRGAWETMQQSAAVSLRPVPVDAEGLDVDALEGLLRREKVNLLYLTPHHQYPTTVTLSPARRARVLDLAQRHRMPILEYDHGFEYHYEGPPMTPLASTDPTGQVIYMSSLSKLIAPGVRLGFLVAPKALAERLARIRVRMDWQGDRVLEWAIADLMRDGDLGRHLRKVRRIYQDRRDHLCGLLRRHLGDALDFTTPSGGLALWVRGREGFDMAGWSERCRARSLHFKEGRAFDFAGGPIPFTRLGFSNFTEAELEDAVARMKAALA